MAAGIAPVGADAFSRVAAARSAAGGETSASRPVDGAGKAFSDMLQSLTQSEQSSDALATRLAMGENVDLHDLTISMEQTDVQFRVAMAIRDKLVDAYREVMRMQV